MGKTKSVYWLVTFFARSDSETDDDFGARIQQLYVTTQSHNHQHVKRETGKYGRYTKIESVRRVPDILAKYLNFVK